MPRLYAFRGHRFDPQIVGKLDDVVTQPYDKISDSLRLEYLDRSPFNVAHLIANSDYEAAGRALESWIRREPFGVMRSPLCTPINSPIHGETGNTSAPV